MGKPTNPTSLSNAPGLVPSSKGGTSNVNSGKLIFDSSNNFIFGAGAQPAGGNRTTGTNDVLIGQRAGANLTTANHHIFIGNDAGYYATDGGLLDTNYSVGIGFTSCKTSREGGNTGLGYLTVGGNALIASNSVYGDVGVGESALSMVSASQKDTAVGSSALQVYQRGGQMTALGRSAGQWVTEGSYSILEGHAAGFFSVVSVNNIFFGNGAGAPTVGNPARITASVTAGVMNVTVKNGSDAAIAIGQTVVSTTGTGFATNYTIQSLGTGSGGTGTYNVLPNNQDAASQTMQSGAASHDSIVIGNSSYSTGYLDHDVIIVGNGVVVTSANNVTAIGNGKTTAYISGNLTSTSNPSILNNAAGVTWATTDILGELITRKGAIAVSDTTPTAAAIVASIPGCEVGSRIRFYVRNKNTGILTILAGTGVTLDADSTTTIATLFTRLYEARVTNATIGTEAVTLYGISTAGN